MFALAQSDLFPKLFAAFQKMQSLVGHIWDLFFHDIHVQIGPVTNALDQIFQIRFIL